jgi:hypothetical protein
LFPFCAFSIYNTMHKNENPCLTSHLYCQIHGIFYTKSVKYVLINRLYCQA